MTGKSRIRVFILCEGESGMAFRCLNALAAHPGIDVAAVIIVDPVKRRVRRKLQKVFRIGLLGALNGIRMRRWYADDNIDLIGLCDRLHIKHIVGVRQNSNELVSCLRGENADLGLSLGNGYISQNIFTIPRFGMINIHSEILPQYQNAQSIIWPIYNEDVFTGFTIHEVNKKIDGGRILYQRKVPIEFCKSLGETVMATRAKVNALIPDALVDVCANFSVYCKAAQVQVGGRSYTTPSIWQFIRMCRNNNKIYGKKN